MKYGDEGYVYGRTSMLMSEWTDMVEFTGRRMKHSRRAIRWPKDTDRFNTELDRAEELIALSEIWLNRSTL